MRAFMVLLGNASLAGAVMILAVLAVRMLFRGMPTGFLRFLWLLAGVRLLLPFSVASPLGVVPAGGFLEYAVSQDTVESRVESGRFDRENGTAVFDNRENQGAAAWIEGGAESAAGTTGANTNGSQTAVYDAGKAAGELTTGGSFGAADSSSAVFFIYCAGVVLLLGYFCFQTMRLAQKVRFAVPVDYEEGDLQERLYYCDEAKTAFVFGLVKPKIYMPSSVTEKELPYVVRHEWAHLRCGDSFVKLIYFLILALHWFNPLVWAAYVCLGKDMETACDERVIRDFDADERGNYADALLRIASEKRRFAAITVAFGEIPVRGRLEHIVHYEKPKKHAVAASAVLCVVLGLCFLTGRVRAENGQTADDEKIAGTAETENRAAKETGQETTEATGAEGQEKAEAERQETADAIETQTPEMKSIDSPHYHLEPDDEIGGYEIYGADGTDLGFFFCNDPLVIAGADGAEKLYTYYDELSAYEVVDIDDELREDIMGAIGEKMWYVRQKSDFVTETDAATKLSFLTQKNHRSWEGKVVLETDADREAFDALADDYVRRYAPVVTERGVGYIYADLEIKGLAWRGENGFVFVQNNGAQYVDVKEPQSGWSVALTFDEYGRLDDWLRAHRADADDRTDFAFWKRAFAGADVEYDNELHPESPRYQAALAQLNAIWGDYPPEGVSKEQAEDQIRNLMKSYDEDGDRLNAYGIAGMDATGKDASEIHRIVDVPEEYRQKMFDLTKRDFVENYGMGRGDDAKEAALLREFQLGIPKEDRLKGTWTLEQYRRAYTEALAEAVRADNPSWEAGDAFAPSLVETLTRQDVETRLSSDGTNLNLE